MNAKAEQRPNIAPGAREKNTKSPVIVQDGNVAHLPRGADAMADLKTNPERTVIDRTVLQERFDEINLTLGLTSPRPTDAEIDAAVALKQAEIKQQAQDTYDATKGSLENASSGLDAQNKAITTLGKLGKELKEIVALLRQTDYEEAATVRITSENPQIEQDTALATEEATVETPVAVPGSIDEVQFSFGDADAEPTPANDVAEATPVRPVNIENVAAQQEEQKLLGFFGFTSRPTPKEVVARVKEMQNALPKEQVQAQQEMTRKGLALLTMIRKENAQGVSVPEIRGENVQYSNANEMDAQDVVEPATPQKASLAERVRALGEASPETSPALVPDGEDEGGVVEAAIIENVPTAVEQRKTEIIAIEAYKKIQSEINTLRSAITELSAKAEEMKKEESVLVAATRKVMSWIRVLMAPQPEGAARESSPESLAQTEKTIAEMEGQIQQYQNTLDKLLDRAQYLSREIAKNTDALLKNEQSAQSQDVSKNREQGKIIPLETVDTSTLVEARKKAVEKFYAIVGEKPTQTTNVLRSAMEVLSIDKETIDRYVPSGDSVGELRKIGNEKVINLEEQATQNPSDEVLDQIATRMELVKNRLEQEGIDMENDGSIEPGMAYLEERLKTDAVREQVQPVAEQVQNALKEIEMIDAAQTRLQILEWLGVKEINGFANEKAVKAAVSKMLQNPERYGSPDILRHALRQNIQLLARIEQKLSKYQRSIDNNYNAYPDSGVRVLGAKMLNELPADKKLRTLHPNVIAAVKGEQAELSQKESFISDTEWKSIVNDPNVQTALQNIEKVLNTAGIKTTRDNMNSEKPYFDLSRLTASSNTSERKAIMDRVKHFVQIQGGKEKNESDLISEINNALTTLDTAIKNAAKEKLSSNTLKRAA